jgi:hypothetical protein
MMALARICKKHRQAVERDLIALGFSGTEDVGTPKLSLWKFAAIVLASPPNSAVYHAETRQGTMSPEAQLLANLSEQQAGLMTLPSRYDRVGVDSAPVAVPAASDTLAELPSMQMGGTAVSLDAFDTPEELKRKREEVAARIRESRKRDTKFRDKYDPFEAAKKARDERIRAGVHQGPPLPAHIAGDVASPPLPPHLRGLS